MLRILVSYNHINYLMFFNQLAYTYQVLICFGIQNAFSVSTSLTTKYELSTSQSPQTKAKKHVYRYYIGDVYYLSLIGSLLFVIQTCSDIQFVVSLVAQFSKNCDIAQLKATKCILYYFKNMADLNLVLEQHKKDSFNLVS